MKNFRTLDIWKRGMNLVIKCYYYTSKLPPLEKYGLISQINKSAVSIPSNIAEGCSRSSNKDFSRFIQIAVGSAYELETQFLLAQKIYNKNASEVIDEIQQLQKMMNSYNSKLDKSRK